IKNISTESMRQALHEGQIVIAAGFQGADENYNITTLGRGGPDTTAGLLPAGLTHCPAGQGTIGRETFPDPARVFAAVPRLAPDEPGVSHRVFTAIAEQNIVVDMIAQNVGAGGRAAIGFTVLKNELPTTLAVVRPLAAELGASVEHEEDVSKVSIVGTGMRTHT